VADAWQTLGWRIVPVGPPWLLRPKFLFYTRDLRVGVDAAPTPADAVWRELTPDDVESVASLVPDETPERIQRRLDEGQRGLVCQVRDSLAHCRWFTGRPTYLRHLSLTLVPQPGDLCHNGAYTAPAFRKRGIFADGIARVLMLAQREGYVRSISHAAWWNYPTRGSVLRRTERRPVGHVGYWNLGVARRYFATGGVHLGSGRTLWIDPAC
jgi:hypothetical protein